MRIINNNILVSEHSIFEEYLKRDSKGVLINTVNCEGFMGKGIALEFKIRFGDEYYYDYEKKCQNREIKVGKIDYYNINNLKVINFPTKNLYKFESKMIWIEEGLNELCSKVEGGFFDDEIIYIPKLGSSQGGLNWEDIYLLIKKKLLLLRNDRVKFIICEDSQAGEIEQSILSKLEIYEGNEISAKVMKNIKDSFHKIQRLRDLLKVKGVGGKTYKKIIDLDNENLLF